MKRKSFFAPILFVVSLLVLCGSAEERTWTRNDGKTVQAELDQIVEGTSARLRLQNGRTYDVPIDSLSEPDQQYLADWQERQKAAPQKKHWMSVWALTDDEKNAGTHSLKLYFELNGNKNLRLPVPARSFVRAGVEEFSRIPMPIAPDAISKIKLMVVTGTDAWRPKKIEFQFGTGDRASEKIEFGVERWLSHDESEGKRHHTFVLTERIALSKKLPSGGIAPAEGAVVLRPTKVENPKPGFTSDDLSEGHIIESDQSRGVLHLSFEDERLASSLNPPTSLTLVLKVATLPNSDTSSTITLWSGRKTLVTKQGAKKGEVLRLALDPADYARKEEISFTVKCGNDAVILKKDVDATSLEVTFKD